MRTEKGLIYHRKVGYVLYNLFSIIDDGELYYIVTADGREIRRQSNLMTRAEFNTVF